MKEFANISYAFALLQSVETFSASLSFVGCSVTLYSILFKRNKSNNSLTNKLLVYLQIIDLISCIFYGIGVSGEKNEGFCQFQGLIVQWFGLAGIFWVTYMSFQMYQWIVKKSHVDRISKYILLHFSIIMITTGILGLILLGLGYYTDAGVWCWIGIDHSDLRFYCFYLLLLIAWLSTIISLNAVSSSLRNRIHKSDDLDNTELQSSERTIQRKLAIYIFIFIFTWFFALLNRFVGFLYGHSVFATAVLQAAILPLRGFLNSIFYGNSIVILYSFFMEKVLCTQKSIKNITNDEYTYHEIDSTIGVPTFTTSNYQSKTFSIFTTTLNFGEASFDQVLKNMEGWIVKGHDIYVICFQECLEIIELKQVILDYIGGINEYIGFDNEIGSGNTQLGYHGYIGLFVFIRVRDLENGHVVPTSAAIGTMATGTNLIVTKAQNKGGVGLPFQIHDTSIAFVSCHLPSDSKGSSKLSKRNASAQSLLRELNLTPEDIGFDAQFQHDHLIVLGDLNYRMDTDDLGGSSGLLGAVATACMIEKQTILNKEKEAKISWLMKKYDLLRETKDLLYPSVFEQNVLLAAKANSRSAWLAVLAADELRMIMEGGDAFYGFFEPLPCFPPSYKRRKNNLGDCGDYTDVEKLLQGYSNIGLDSILAMAAASSLPPLPTPSLSTKERTTSSSSSSSSSSYSSSSSSSSSSQKIVMNVNSVTSNELQPLRPLYSQATLVSQGSADMEVGYGTTQLQRSNDESTVDTSIIVTPKKDNNNNNNNVVALRFDDNIRILIDDDIDNESIATSMSPSPKSIRGGNNSKEDSEIEKNNLQRSNTNPSLKTSTKASTKDIPRRVAFNSNIHTEENFPQVTEVKEDIKKIRPPSYTDRIIIHSLDDRREKLTIQAYDCCDSMRASDHRPVCMTIRLEVNSTVKYTENATGKYRKNIEGVTVGMYELSILNLSVHLGDTFIEDQDSHESNDEDDDEVDVNTEHKDVAPNRPRKKSDDVLGQLDSVLITDNPNTSDTSSNSNKSSNSTSSRIKVSSGKYLRVSLAQIRATRELEITTGVTSYKTKKTNIGLISNKSNDQVLSSKQTHVSSSPRSQSRKVLEMNTSTISNKESDELRPVTPLSRTSSGAKVIEEGLFQTPSELARTVTADNAWRLKVEEDDRIRHVMKNEELSYRIKKSLGKKLHLHLINDKKTDKIVSSVTVVFPLPSKDPLLTNRNIHGLAEALQVDSSQLFSAYKETADRCMPGTTLDTYINTQTANTNIPTSDPIVDKDGFLRPASVFPWLEQNKDLKLDNIQSLGQKTVDMKVSGVLSPDLGAHVLLKIQNKAGFDLGECVVSLSHLITSNPYRVMKTEVKKIPISSGGQIMGEATATFALRYLSYPESPSSFSIDGHFSTSLSSVHSVSSLSSHNPLLDKYTPSSSFSILTTSPLNSVSINNSRSIDKRTMSNNDIV